MEPSQATSQESPAGNEQVQAGLATLARETEALRVQSAAVAGQQAALVEEELRLQQQRAALAQQEAQLSAHLDEKRRRLATLRHEVQEAHKALKSERASYQNQIAATTRELEIARAEIADGSRSLHADRRRLLRLRQRLKQRWHRHWAAERQIVRQREDELKKQARLLVQEKDRLQEDKADFDCSRLRCNGELELARRQLQAGWSQLQNDRQTWESQHDRQQTELNELALCLQQRASALQDAEQSVAERQRLGQARLLALAKELEGLETRIVNQRRLLRELAPAGHHSSDQAAFDHPRTDADQSAVAKAENPEQVCLPGAPIGSTVVSAAALDSLARELADQRWHLTEQYKRLLQTQQRWQEDRDQALRELEMTSRCLQEREQALESAENCCRRWGEELTHRQQNLEHRQALLTTNAASWQAEQASALAELLQREKNLQRRLTIVRNLCQLWQERQRRLVSRLQDELTSCAELRHENSVLRERWLRDHALLGDKQRALAARVMAWEQYEQQFITQAASPAQASKRLERLRRHWTALFAVAEQTLTQQRQTLLAELKVLSERHQGIQEWIENNARREAALVRRQTAWEQEKHLADNEAAKLRQQLHLLRTHHAIRGQQLAELNNEVERLAKVLMDDGNAPGLRIGQAA
jgi:hypothetical protein